MQSTLGLSLQAWVSETVRGITESSRVLVSYYGEWVGTPSKSDFASSLIQEISKRVIKFVSQSGKSCLQVQGATAKQWSMYNSGFPHTHTQLEWMALSLCFDIGTLNAGTNQSQVLKWKNSGLWHLTHSLTLGIFQSFLQKRRPYGYGWENTSKALWTSQKKVRRYTWGVNSIHLFFLIAVISGDFPG